MESRRARNVYDNNLRRWHFVETPLFDRKDMMDMAGKPTVATFVGYHATRSFSSSTFVLGSEGLLKGTLVPAYQWRT